MITGGLVQSTNPAGIRKDNKHAFIGITFGHQGIPIDLATIVLAGVEFKGLSLMLADEFLRLNNHPEEEIQKGLAFNRKTLEVLAEIYGVEMPIITASDFMRDGPYKHLFERLKKASRPMQDALVSLVPQRYRGNENALLYPLHEAACTDYVSKSGIEVKLGPSSEAPYDRFMQKIGIRMEFAYLVDAYAFGTPYSDKVVHYVPTNKGKHMGERILLDEPTFESSKKLLTGSPEASKYLLTVASVAGKRLGSETLTPEDIRSISASDLEKETQRLVLKNIIEPYKAAIGTRTYAW